MLPFGSLRPRIDPSAWIAPGATVVGDVEIGPDSSVFFGCVLRGDVHAIRIGSRTNVQDNSVLHVTKERFPTWLGDEVTVGHRAVVHGCRVGDGALIGIGAIVMDGAEVGEEALVGAGALVPPGATVPPGALVIGAPARIVRSLSASERTLQRTLARHYVTVAHAHRASGSGT